MTSSSSSPSTTAAGSPGLTAEEREAVWDEAETKTYFFIPGLFRFIGVALHCYLGILLAFLDTAARVIFEFLRARVESMTSFDPSSPAGAGRKAPKARDPVSDAVGGFMAFYTKYFYNPISDCWNRPIQGAAAKEISVIARRWVDDHGVRVLRAIQGGPTRRCANLGSYNYLGFGGPNEITTPGLLESLDRSGVAFASTAAEMGVSAEQRELEGEIARFVGKEDAVVVPMGFATNSMIIPSLAGKGCLIISDSLNHASIITGMRTSGAVLRKVAHSDVGSFEAALKVAVAERPRWKRILVVVEGLYSMEGELCPLPGIVKVAKRYGAMVYIDEAHSIGALGPHGRGICDYYGIDPSQVDVLMGTFTKSFGSIGGYVAADAGVVAMLRRKSLACIYGATMSPACARQVVSALRELDTPRGARRIAQLRSNSVLLRKRLSDAGCNLLGPADSPVIPVLVVHPWKLTVFSRECLRRGVAAVIVGYPATPLLGLRTRFCVSAAFSTQEVEDVASTIIEVSRLVGMDYYSAKPREQIPAFDPNAQTKENQLDDEDEDAPVTDYVSEPIVSASERFREVRVLDPSRMPHIVLSTHDYLGLTNRPETVTVCKRICEEYGCGSCGPRGFYGTTDKHLEVENCITRWLGLEATILYSYGALAATSSLTPYANEPEDLILYDESINLPLRLGVRLCKAQAIPFPHNNAAALVEIIKAVESRRPRGPMLPSPGAVVFGSKGPRKFIVTEGIFAGSGDICPLPDLVAIKRKFGFMLLVDETHSIGSLGTTGRGVREYFAETTGDQSLLDDHTTIDLLVGTFEAALGSIGGFCCGQRKLIQHQVLNALGYVFSASLPPYLCQAAIEAVNLLDAQGPGVRVRLQRLRENTVALREAVRSQLGGLYRITGNEGDDGRSEASPLIFVSLCRGVVPGGNPEVEKEVLEKVEEECWKSGEVGVTVAQFAEGDSGAAARPSLRLAASAAHPGTPEYNHALEAIASCTRRVLAARPAQATTL